MRVSASASFDDDAFKCDVWAEDSMLFVFGKYRGKC